jgi:type VI secretion system protein ImpF
MPRGDGLERTAKPSIIDRLIDLAPAEAADRPMTRDESVRAYRSSILRDLEWLLNTRRTVVPVPESLTNVRASTFNYGLPDVSSLSADSMETRADLVRQIERTIRDFEPRLLDVRVTMSDDDRVDRQIRFVIEGLLDMEPNPERVVFDTVLEMSSGDFSVRASS